MKDAVELSLDLLRSIRAIDSEMQYKGRQIDAIDSGARNRAYTLVEIKQEDLLQAELDEKRKERDRALSQLEVLLGVEGNAKRLKDELMKRYQKASNSDERNEIRLYSEIVGQVCNNLSMKKAAGRIKKIQEAKNQSSRFGQKYARREDDGDR